MHPENPIVTRVNTKGLASVTMYGCCANFPNFPLKFMTYKTTNTNGWINFLWEINEELERRHITGKVLLVVDGHPAHFTERAKKHLGRLQLWQLPSYCKSLHGIAAADLC